jgi:hypothetical protein
MRDVEVTWQQVARWRLHRQLVLEPAPNAVAAAQRLCGVHGQVASSAVLIAGIRTAARAGLDAALWTDRMLVRTWATRGTLNLLPAEDLDVWGATLTDRESRRRFPPSWEREHGVTATQLHAVTHAVGEVLGAEPMTRAELADAVCARLGDPALAAPLSTGWARCSSPPPRAGSSVRGPARAVRSHSSVRRRGWAGPSPPSSLPPRTERSCCGSSPPTGRAPRRTSRAGGASSRHRRSAGCGRW